MKSRIWEGARMPETIAPPETLPFTPLVYPKVEFPDDPLHATPQLWRKAELVEWTQCSPEFISCEIRAGRLRVVFLSSGRLRFHWADIVRWMRARTQAMKGRRGIALDE
jgi:hypothetical protein